MTSKSGKRRLQSASPKINHRAAAQRRSTASGATPRRICRDVEMDDPSSSVIDHKPDIQKTKPNHWNHEEIHRRDSIPTILEKRQVSAVAVRDQAATLADTARRWRDSRTIRASQVRRESSLLPKHSPGRNDESGLASSFEIRGLPGPRFGSIANRVGIPCDANGPPCPA